MHTLLFLVVVSSVPLVPEASLLNRLELTPSLTRPGSQRERFHLLDGDLDETSGDESSTSRVLVELLGGLGGEVAGLIPGGLAFSQAPTFAMTMLAVSLAVVGCGAGVSVAGWGMDGRGRFGFALLGSVIGFVVPLLAGTGLLLSEDCDTNTFSDCGALVPMVLGMLLLPPIGATLGYELSAPTPWLSHGYAARAHPSAPRLFPVLALARKGLGGTVGIAVRL